LDGGGIRDADISLEGKDVFAEIPAGLKTNNSLDVKLVSQKDRLVLEGQIEVQEGFFESALDALSRSPEGLEDTKAETLRAQGAASHSVGLDIKIVTRQPVEMDNNLGRISGTADLRLAGTVDQVRLLGSLRLEPEGRLYFGDRTYYIERGTVRFLDAPKTTPELDIHAYTRTNYYTIHLGLTGVLSEITTTLTSDPPLSRDDVISVLLTGRTVADNKGVDVRTLEAFSVATGAMNVALSSRLRRTFGVSRVSIQPSAIAAESNPGTRVTMTQDFSRTFRILYSINLTDSSDQIWVGEYDLTRSLATRLVKQSDNTYRGEFRHDIRFGSSAPAGAIRQQRQNARRVSEVRFTGADPFRPEELAKIFKVKAGQQYKPIKARKGSQRLTNFLMKNGYLESRVRLDREDDGPNIRLTVRVETGSPVQMVYRGASISKRQKSRMRTVWHAGISDQQRPQAAKEAILGYFVEKGFPRAQADARIASQSGHKTVTLDLRPGPRFHGVKTVVEGAAPERTQEILSLLDNRSMKRALYRDTPRVVEAITRYYQQRGYLAAKVSPPLQNLDAARRTGRIVIPVIEGPVFHVGELRFSGNQALAAADLSAGILVAAGAVFEPARLHPAAAALKQKYGRLGYRETQVAFSLERHDDEALVDVSYHIVENRQTSIGAIRVEGNRHTSEKFARSRLRIAEGQVANADLIGESVKSLSQTGAYTSTDVQVKAPAEADRSVRPVADAGASDKRLEVADLIVAVTEPKPFRLLYGGLYDSGNGPGFIADFQNQNFLGAGRTLGLRTRVDSETDEARLYLTRPFWRQRRVSTTLATYFTRELQYKQTVPTETLGASIQQDVQLRSKWLLSYGYRFERQRGFVPDPAAPTIPATVVFVAPLTLTFSRDARDSFLDATRGSFISHGFEIAPGFLGSDYPYARYYAQYFKYFPLTRPRPVPYGEKERRSRLVFATGTRLGLQKGFNAEGAVLTDRFFAGGGTTVRGFHQDELGPRLANGEPAGGNAVLVLNEELRYPLFWIFDAVTFVDLGNVFPRVSDFRLSELRAASGFGLRIRNPFVVLRFDYGLKLGRRPGESLGAFFFSIGQAF
jgi:outer membrane protein assembly complex protein YaeT